MMILYWIKGGGGGIQVLSVIQSTAQNDVFKLFIFKCGVSYIYIIIYIYILRGCIDVEYIYKGMPQLSY